MRILKKWLFMELWPGNPGGSGSPFAKCPKKQPRAYWNRLQSLRWACILVTGGAVLLAALCLWGMLPGIPRWTAFIFFLLVNFSSALWTGATRSRLQRFVRKLQDNDLHVCINCGYSLRGLPVQHTCPECGTDYDAVELCGAWEYWIEKRRLPAAFVDSQSTKRPE